MPTPKLGLAVQGSFGHEPYALGILQGLQDGRNGQRIPLVAATANVEMLAPTLLYAQGSNGADLAAYHQSEARNVLRELFTPRLIPNLSPQEAASRLTQAGQLGLYYLLNPRTLAAAAADGSLFWEQLKAVSPNGVYQFNPAFIEQLRPTLEEWFAKAGLPVFTNILNAKNLAEHYLLAGPLPSGAKLEKPAAGHHAGRVLEPLTTDRFFASGARPPFLPPYEVEGEFFLEGAMRCNPPLNPLIECGCEAILLLRFFAKDKPRGNTQDGLELYDRYLEVIFGAPLQKEIETIELVNRLLEKTPIPGKQPVRVIDASSANDGVPAFRELVERELDYASHFAEQIPQNRERMYERGHEIGRQLAETYRGQLWD